MKQPKLFEDSGRVGVRGSRRSGLSSDLASRSGRARFAIEPENDVVLEASAGTGKTRVLVDRYVRLSSRASIPAHPRDHVHAKAAAEMRERVLAELRAAPPTGGMTPTRWRELQRAHRRNPDLHHRRVLLRPAARVSARSRCRAGF